MLFNQLRKKMLDLKFVRENPDLVRQNIINKNEKANLDGIIKLDEKRRELIQEADALKNQRNIVSAEIAQLKKSKENADEKIAAMKVVSDRIKELDDVLRDVESEMDNELLYIPNMVDPAVPIGKSADDNVTARSWGVNLEKEWRKDHIELSKELGILDFERGAKVSGGGFAFYVGKGATLERALINFMLDTHINKNGYKEFIPPMLVNANSMRGTGQIPKMVDDMYYCEKDDLYLIPTAEVPLTNYYNGEYIPYDEMTIKICGYSSCFRREAGSYGKDTRGFLRVHEFNKVELVKFAKPEDSYNELEALVVNVEDILQALKIPYRVLLLCSGDTSFSSAKTYDLEVWAPGEQKYLEASSCSNFLDFQARRANIRFRRETNAKPEFAHTLNGSGLATSRLMVAIMENYQTDDGHILVPEVLQKYTGFEII